MRIPGTLIPLIAFLILHSTHAFAEDITNRAGTVYRNVSITSVEPDGITVRHAIGISKLPFSSLPKVIQDRYGYDAQKASAYSDSTLQAQNEAAKLQAQIRLAKAVAEENYDVTLRIARIVDDIYTFAHATYTVEVESVIQRSKTVPDDSRLKGPGMKQPYKTVQYQEKSKRLLNKSLGYICVVGLPKHLAANDVYKTRIFRAGRVPPNIGLSSEGRARYATSRELAVQLILSDGNQEAPEAIAAEAAPRPER